MDIFGKKRIAELEKELDEHITKNVTQTGEIHCLKGRNKYLESEIKSKEAIIIAGMADNERLKDRIGEIEKEGVEIDKKAHAEIQRLRDDNKYLNDIIAENIVDKKKDVDTIAGLESDLSKMYKATGIRLSIAKFDIPERVIEHLEACRRHIKKLELETEEYVAQIKRFRAEKQRLTSDNYELEMSNQTLKEKSKALNDTNNKLQERCENTLDTLHNWQAHSQVQTIESGLLQAEKRAIIHLLQIDEPIKKWTEEKELILNGYKDKLSNDKLAWLINAVSGTDHSEEAVRRKLSRMQEKDVPVRTITSEVLSISMEDGNMPEVFNADNLKAGMFVKIKTWENIATGRELDADGDIRLDSTNELNFYSTQDEVFVKDKKDRVVEVERVTNSHFYAKGSENYLPFQCIECIVEKDE